MKPEDALRQLHKLAGSAADIAPVNTAHAALKGMYLGALFSLAEAMALRFQDRAGAISSTYRRRVTTSFRLLAVGKPPLRGQWLAGFYFNDGLFRLAAIYHRGLKLATGSTGRLDVACLRQIADIKGVRFASGLDALAKLHREVNRLKHDADGLAGGRTIAISDVVKAAREAGQLVKMDGAS